MNVLSFTRYQPNRIYLNVLNDTPSNQEFLVKMTVSYLDNNFTGTYTFTVYGGSYQATVLLFFPALPIVPCIIRISALELSKSSLAYGEILTLYDYPPS